MAGVGGDGVVRARLPGDLVELVEVDDAVLGALRVLVGGVVEVAYGDFDVGADEARLREAGGIGDSERYVEEL